MAKDKLRQLLNVSFAILQPIVAGWVTLEIAGPSIGAISNRYPTYVVPAGYAFSIWALIFALCLGYGVWQALSAQRTNLLLRRIGWLTASALACTSIWMLLFQRTIFFLSLIIMLCLLTSLIGVVTRIYQGNQMFSLPEKWLVYITFSIFLGWITVATVANVGQILVVFEWSGWGIKALTWGIIALLLSGTLASLVTAVTRGNIPFAVTVIWALVAVAVNQFSGTVQTNSPIVGTVAISMVVLIACTLIVSHKCPHSWQRLYPNENMTANHKKEHYAGYD